ncbi:MAG: hypothetical protein ACPG7F_18215 [Aggregatilineales bacterium]
MLLLETIVFVVKRVARMVATARQDMLMWSKSVAVNLDSCM